MIISGDNHIIIVAGANNRLGEQNIIRSSSLLNQAAVVVFQFETPVSTTLLALKHCKQHNPSGW